MQREKDKTRNIELIYRDVKSRNTDDYLDYVRRDNTGNYLHFVIITATVNTDYRWVLRRKKCSMHRLRIELAGLTLTVDSSLLGPLIVTAKLILQELWQTNIEWDEPVPQSIYSRWTEFKKTLPEINQLRISRCVKFAIDPRLIQIHGFCDASQNTYGACIYVRTRLNANEYRTELLCSKSRKRVKQVRQHFWRRWSSEYLHSLQERTKWRSDKGTQFKSGQLVLIKQ